MNIFTNIVHVLVLVYKRRSGFVKRACILGIVDFLRIFICLVLRRYGYPTGQVKLIFSSAGT